ncbi:AMP-binding protein [Rhodococcoides kyotonense]|uniref:AMP-binding enzyme n=1 Tax=Rhodococcoides kyotonense TaxID=398843 RepID=A0A239E1T8_9NOCA|nr:AMP-binding protein [Rhodococcus kyotonensis]SNS38567.1 AMP-binding enzyme [Rhodococcus kyotonensis]
MNVRPALSHLLDRVPADVVAVDGELEYGALADAAHYLAECLGRAGVGRGSRVGVLVAGGAEFTVVLCALDSLGATVVLLRHTDMPHVVLDRMRRGDVAVVLGHVRTEHVLDDVLFEAAVVELPTVVADEYTLVAVSESASDERQREIVFFSGCGSDVRMCWESLVKAGAEWASSARVRAGSTVTIDAGATGVKAVTALVAGLSVGATVAFRTPETSVALHPSAYRSREVLVRRPARVSVG